MCVKIEECVCCCSLISLSLPDADCDKVTAVLLKSRTGEFDLESILFLKLRGLGKILSITRDCFLCLELVLIELSTARLAGIHDLGCIGECMNLERLDLSVNNISNLAPLASLRHLSVLNLSSNKISSLGECFCLDVCFRGSTVHSFVQIDPDSDDHVLYLSSKESLRSCENIQNLNLAGNLISRYLK